MSAIALEQTTTYLTRQVRRWDRRLRLVTSLVWLPRGLLAGMTVGLVVALVARLRPWLLPEQVAWAAGVAVLVSGLVALGTVWLWPRPTPRAARYFDRRFELKERVSTALELSSGVIPFAGPLAERQLSDTVSATRRLNLAARLPVRVRWGELALLVILATLLAYLLIADNPQADKLRAERQLEEAISTQVAELEQAIEEIEANDALTEAEKEALAEPLQEALDLLQQPDITQPEAVAALAEANQSLQELSDGMLPDQEAAYDEAARELAGSDLTGELARAFKEPDLAQAAEAVDDLATEIGMSDLSQQEREDLANRLEQAANALEETNPALAEKLREAATALRAGDTQAAQDALREAAQMLGEQQEQLEDTALAQAAQQAQQQVTQGQQSLAQAGQQPQPDSAGQPQSMPDQPGQQPGQTTQGQTQPQSQPASGDMSQTGQAMGQPGTPQAGQVGSGSQPDTASGQPGAPQTGVEPGQQAAGQTTGPGSQPVTAQQADAANAASDINGPGAGDEPGGPGNDTTAGVPNAGGQGEISTDNSPPDNEGIEEFVPSFAPSTIGGQGGDVVDLSGQNPNADSFPVEEGEFGPNPSGESSLSYTGVFRDYQDAVSDALDSGRIPLDQRDVIHDYFSSLEP